MVATMVRSIFAQPDPESVWAQHRRVVDHLRDVGLTDAATHLDKAAAEILTFTGFPKAHWRQIWSNNPQERLNKEIRRRTNVVGIFPTRPSVIRLVGALLAEQHDVRVGMTAAPRGCLQHDVPTACGCGLPFERPLGEPPSGDVA